MKAENAIEVHDIKKSFRVYLDKGRTLKSWSYSVREENMRNVRFFRGLALR